MLASIIFRRSCAAEFSNQRGFTIRGRRLFEVLEQNRSAGPSALPYPNTKESRAALALAALEDTHDLFESLDRLVKLKDQLEKEGQLLFSKAFPYDDFAALKSAREFLMKIFGSPEELHKRIEEFRLRLHNVHWESYVPNLQDWKDISELVENIRFIWPYNRFRLPPAVTDYLGRSAFIAEIHAEIDSFLSRYPALKQEWGELEKKRVELLKDLQNREEQRRSAERYVREQHPQPVFQLLEPIESGAMPNYTATLQSLLFFNAYLALCENHCRFQGEFIKKPQARNVLERFELGNVNALLRGYLGELRTSGRLKESVFSGWDTKWPERGGQRDAARLAADIASSVLERYKGGMMESDRSRLQKLQEWKQDNAPPEDLLDVLVYLRNRFDKAAGQGFWQQYQADIWDLLRRFVTATTKPHFRFGVLSDDGRQAQLWARPQPELLDLETITEKAPHGRLCVFLGPTPQPVFPIDEFICIHPAEGSVWIYFSGGRWIDLTNDGRGDIDRYLVAAPDNPWIPTTEQIRSSAIWSAIHGA